MVRLESVRRKSGGRIHLTPRLPKSGPVTTLCGQVLGEGAYTDTDAVADCANCIRRSKDQSRISSAFFEQDEGSELLKLSLEHARQRRPEKKEGAPGAQVRPMLRVVPPPASPPDVPEEAGELATDGFKSSGQGVWRSPAGVTRRSRVPVSVLERRHTTTVARSPVLGSMTHQGWVPGPGKFVSSSGMV